MICFDPQYAEPQSPGKRRRGEKPMLMQRRCKDLRYAFDNVFDSQASQQQVFDNTARHIIDSVLEGYNATCFAYGATGAGKTHTMLGTEDAPGICVLTIQELYEKMAVNKGEIIYEIEVSYLEVYNETLCDLLCDRSVLNNAGLQLREDKEQGVVVNGLSRFQPKNAQELYGHLERGNRNRTQHATDANAQSSRSHAVFFIYVSQRAHTAQINTHYKHAKLLLIDLAGSERAITSTNTGLRMREGANINKSLLALGNCFNALFANTNKFNSSANRKTKNRSVRSHVPYRDSKLTRLLKDSLGGNSKTLMIVNISPSSLWYEDTHNTLKYANRAKNIKTSVVCNSVSVERHVAQYVELINELRAENIALKAINNELKSKSSNPSSINNQPILPTSYHQVLYEKILHEVSLIINEKIELEEGLANVQQRGYDMTLTVNQIDRACDRIIAIGHRNFHPEMSLLDFSNNNNNNNTIRNALTLLEEKRNDALSQEAMLDASKQTYIQNMNLMNQRVDGLLERIYKYRTSNPAAQYACDALKYRLKAKLYEVDCNLEIKRSLTPQLSRQKLEIDIQNKTILALVDIIHSLAEGYKNTDHQLIQSPSNHVLSAVQALSDILTSAPDNIRQMIKGDANGIISAPHCTNNTPAIKKINFSILPSPVKPANFSQYNTLSSAFNRFDILSDDINSNDLLLSSSLHNKINSSSLSNSARKVRFKEDSLHNNVSSPNFNTENNIEQSDNTDDSGNTNPAHQHLHIHAAARFARPTKASSSRYARMSRTSGLTLSNRTLKRPLFLTDSRSYNS